jgi:GT2 family glycosyltransferase
MPMVDAALPRHEGVVARLHHGETCEHGAFPPETCGDLGTGVSLILCTYQRPESLARFLRSLTEQEPRPDRLIVVDASPGADTERMLRDVEPTAPLAGCLCYLRVAGRLRGLTRQRNLGLRFVATDLVAFFDDDIVLLPHCLAELERHCRRRSDIVGVAARIVNECRPPDALWRLRRRLRLVPELSPGRYFPSGISTPWGFLPPTGEFVEGDWLPGGATMWRTEVARALGFCEEFDGYALGEDLDFSLRARRRGRLGVAGTARLLHLREPSGRPAWYQLGVMGLRNADRIHRRAYPDREWQARCWFAYAWAIDTLLLARRFRSPRLWAPGLLQIAGRLRAFWEIATHYAMRTT